MEINPYLVVIGISLAVILSFIFNTLSRKTRVPSVLMLIVTGILISQVSHATGFEIPSTFGVLKFLGVIGLLMIVLEGALDLKLERKKSGMIFKAFLAALIILVLTSFAIAGLFMFFLQMDLYTSLVYAVPLSVISSAIVIPSVEHLLGDKKEFLVYDSTFSDILGIMFFDFLIFENETALPSWVAISGNVVFSIVASIVLSVLLVILMQRFTGSKVKMTMFISILSLMFAVGKYFHFSALLVVLFFGLAMENPEIFMRGPLQRFHKENVLNKIRTEFVLITEEFAFLIRTLFFIVFGISMDLAALVDIKVILIGVFVLGSIFFIRFGVLRGLRGMDIQPDAFMAPRGLITVLLFYKIPDALQASNFSDGIIFFVILGSSLLMMMGLMRKKESQPAAISMGADESLAVEAGISSGEEE